MTTITAPNAFGTLVESDTLKIHRRLPGPIDRGWAYLTQSDLRRQWLAAGEMELVPGAPVELVWRNDDLTDPPGTRPEGASAEHRRASEIIEVEPLRKLSIAWGNTGGVTFELKPDGDEVVLTVTHRRVPDRSTILSVSAGWHAHLDILAAMIGGQKPRPFWDRVGELKAEYEQRLPG